VPWLAELQPELFIEVSPELAKERGIENAGWATVSTPRGAIECKALVTRRLRPLLVNGRTVHQAGMPWHWGYRGVVTGAVVNTLASLVGDPNVTIHEGKAFMCRIDGGRKGAEVLAALPDPATPLPHVGRRERQAAEANIDHGIELADAAKAPEELGLEVEAVAKLVGGHYSHPDSVYHA
jgi:predicted molibdopterin-dependent oxidoreductase YjgC